MDRRKRKSPIEEYIESVTDTPEKLQKTGQFYQGLRQFYKRKWNAPLKVPHVQGVEVNLFRLYDTVQALGGWQKVSSNERWPDVAEMLGVKDDVLNGDHAVKVIYMRYLSKYEQNETVGDMDDMMDNELLRSRRQLSFFATSENPVSIPKHDSLRRDREQASQCGDVDYARLTKSLLSGLPNEVDFALNICTLLSHPGPRLLRLSNAPHMLALLVAHAGVFDDDEQDVSDLYEHCWKKVSGRDFSDFWATAGISDDQLALFVPHAVEKKRVDGDANLLAAISYEFNAKDPVAWRVQQIATIVRNLSFEAVNRVSMAENWPLVKFLLLCANSRWSPLYTNALDTLSNLASDFDLTWNRLLYCSNHALLQTIRNGIFSEDKFKFIRSVEMLAGLCNFEGNEATICEFLKKDVLSKIFDIVAVKDIMMCVYTLECLYQISEMGSDACSLLAEFQQAINMLVSLSTIEAVSFGPSGLVGMKVVEFHGPAGLAPQHAMQAAAPPHGGGGAHPAQMHPQQHSQQPNAIPQHMQQHYQQQRFPPQTPPHGHPMQAGGGHPHHPGTPQQQHTPARAPPPHAPPPQPQPVGQRIAPANVNVGENKVDQLTAQWIRQNCEGDTIASTPRGELYAAYVDDLRNIYHSLSGSLQQFSNTLKMLYPDVQFVTGDQTTLMLVKGIRLMRPHRLVSQSAATPSSHLHQQQPQQAPHASAPRPMQSASPAPANVAASHPLMQQMLLSKTPVTNGVNGGRKRSESVASAASEDSRSRTPVDGQLVPAVACEATDAAIHETKIVRVENVAHVPAATQPTTQSAAQLKSAVAKRMMKEEKERKNGEVKTNGKCEQNGEVAEEAEEEQQEGKSIEEKENKKLTNGCANGVGHDDEEEEEEEEEGRRAGSSRPSSSTEEPAAAATAEKEKVVDQGELMCEWDGCGRRFVTAASVLHHASKTHVRDEDVCRWPGCDATRRSRWSLVTHLQDHHCTENVLRQQAARRKEGTLPEKPMRYQEDIPRELPAHPGYSRHAAVDAIRRHAFNFLPRDITDDPEGPVTKSIRLTACLILRNLARYSAEGRHVLRRHERHLCWLALSRLESGNALCQLLSELHEAPTEAPATSASQAV